MIEKSTIHLKESIRLGGFKMATAIDISWIGALSGLALAIILILFRLAPTYSLFY